MLRSSLLLFAAVLLQMRGDVMGRFQNALYLGDVREQVCVYVGDVCLHVSIVGVP